MPIIHFSLEDMEVEAPVSTAFQQIVEACGADVTFGCRNGTCGTCRVRIEEGTENISIHTPEEKEFLALMEALPNERLGCQIKILGNCRISYIGS